MALHPLTRPLVPLLFLLLVACNQQTAEPVEPAAATGGDSPPRTESATEAEQPSRPKPPAPPLFEDFEGQPRISLFPRAGQVRPDEKDELFPFWLTYLDHLRRITGVLQLETDQGSNRVFAFRGLKNVDSVGYFSPMAVEPDTSYRVSVRIRTDLPPQSWAGIGIQEFDRFLWIPDQFDSKLKKEHLLASHVGFSLNGRNGWGRRQFTFTTGPKTRMIHLILFIDGQTDRKPVLFDDLTIEPVE
ncbi:hypothetical protein EDC39_11158 [Geothermobacter ehrlichii]|uniref:CBM11 domain-containing protein n=1 Tax=Geothermobacter ehrlichii TaxID=213224 RepID=A0A5D3WG32_9BACT|nr:hypothetical protein [Geothermobacter ehrlichii]TYO97128.1 hypothetical protein EDC39_11158 [Geothermobacter ehrlichii]